MMHRNDVRSAMSEIHVASSLDGSVEPNLFFFPEGRRNVPLLVGLHTWSYDRSNQVENLLPLCRSLGWALLLPEARGANLTSNPRVRQAGGSPLAQQDVIDAVQHVHRHYPLDPERRFLVGGSGGGHLALLTAARRPELWAAVSAWVPITDLAVWHGENPDYAGHVAACCGGPPGSSPAVDRRYRDRSPLFWVERLATVNLSVHHGRFDPVVAPAHSWRLAEAIEQQGPRRFFFEIFDGGHDIRAETALNWFDGVAASTERRIRLTG